MQESTTQFAAASTKIVEIEKKLQVFLHQPSFWEQRPFLTKPCPPGSSYLKSGSSQPRPKPLTPSTLPQALGSTSAGGLCGWIRKLQEAEKAKLYLTGATALPTQKTKPWFSLLMLP